ncbi:hypothetical protein [Corynebacterium pseudotuberculosis]|uniref:hypothetical protein n=1 Tax=Corynebacterium pseudotuberculosis TaxID=1719 RepID=UPI0011D03D8C|nr:hypothetical protein [Corynebacterium pseudotuberculosis]MBT1069812.1 hypothetical protein [Corynebacterium pseudotuberculosis]QGW57343.1 hypothetical protein CPFRC_07325 [Corynebacterium pseudotuberculosis FRC41]
MSRREQIALASFLVKPEGLDAIDSRTESDASVDGSRLVPHSSSVTVVNTKISSRIRSARARPPGRAGARHAASSWNFTRPPRLCGSHGSSRIRLTLSHGLANPDF